MDDVTARPARKGMTAAERWWAKVAIRDSGCWEWTAATHHGYGVFRADGHTVQAHRYGYEMLVGPIPDGLQIDHLCRNRACVNPAHLEPVSQAENIRRGESRLIGPRRAQLRTHCPSGHPYDGENTGTYQGWRFCRTCSRAAVRRYRERKRKERSLVDTSHGSSPKP